MAGRHRAGRIVKRFVTAATLAMGALVVQAADFALTHIDEEGTIAKATHGFRTIHRLPASQA
jgi:hypothetical protein